MQPLDQGISRCFKAYFRTRLVKHTISSCTLPSTPDQVVITALDAAYWIAKTWNDGSESTIRNTFRTAGFDRHRTINTMKDNAKEISEFMVNPTALSTDDYPFEKLDALFSHITFSGAHVSASEFVNLDEEIPVFS